MTNAGGDNPPDFFDRRRRERRVGVLVSELRDEDRAEPREVLRQPIDLVRIGYRFQVGKLVEKRGNASGNRARRDVC